MSESTTGRVVFKYAEVEWLRGKSKKKLLIVHDEGTYLMSDSKEKGADGRLLNIRPVSGGWEAGSGDDFAETVPLEMLLPTPGAVKTPKYLVLDFAPEAFEVWVDGECTNCGEMLSLHETKKVRGGREFICKVLHHAGGGRLELLTKAEHADTRRKAEARKLDSDPDR